MFYRGACSHTAIDWSDPEQASLQAKIDGYTGPLKVAAKETEKLGAAVRKAGDEIVPGHAMDGDCLGPGWTINGATDQRYHGNLNIRRVGLDVNRLMSDLRDIAFSAGSACASGSGRSSHVLRAIGLAETQARASIRLGFGRYTTETKLRDAIDALVAAAKGQWP